MTKVAQTPRPERRRIRRWSLHASVIAQLRDMIVEGELREGERINETEVCKIVGVSRTPLREALKVLATEGLVELRANRGSAVTTVTPDSVLELFEAAAGVERHAAELAAERTTAQQLRRLRTLHERMDAFFKAGDRRSYFHLNHRIHETIVALSGNSVLEAVHSSLMVRLRRARYKALYSDARWREAVAEHFEILAALEARDSEAAGRLLHDHVHRTGEVLKLLLADSSRSRNPLVQGPEPVPAAH